MPSFNEDLDKVIFDIVERYAKNLVNAAKENLVFVGAVASSRLLDSIRFDIDIVEVSKKQRGLIAEEVVDTFRVTISMMDYGKHVDEGSSPHWLPYNPDKKTFTDLYNPGGVELGWLQDKGLRLRDKPKSMTFDREMRSLAFLVARKISKKGTRATHFFRDAKRKHSIDKLNKAIKIGVGQEILLELRELKK